MELPYSIKQPATLDHLSAMRSFVQDIWLSLHLNPKLASKLDLVLEEILVNVIKYAYPDPERPGEVLIRCGLTDTKTFSVLIQDQGIAFNPLEGDPPDTKQDIEHRPIGGLGIFLVREITDRIEYTRENNSNIITLHFQNQNP